MGQLDLRTFAFRTNMRECEVAKAKVRECDGEGAKVRRCDGEARRCEDAKAKKRYYYRSFTFATSHSRLRLFYSIQKVSVDYIEFDAGTILAKVFRLIHDNIGTHPLGLCAYYECI